VGAVRDLLVREAIRERRHDAPIGGGHGTLVCVIQTKDQLS
jgi:hypothetical protein